MIRRGLVAAKQAQEFKKPGAGLQRGAGSRIGHVGDSPDNKLLAGQERPASIASYFIASAGSMNFFTTNAL